MTELGDSEKSERLLKQLRELWNERQQAVSQQWNRTLSFGGYVVDRWEKAERLGFGDDASIYDSSIVLGNVEVGKHSWIGPFTVLDGSGGLKIGSYCSISAGVQIYSHDSVKWATSGGKEPYEYSPTEIGNRCYIGPNTIIAKGSKIGDGCVIGANSLVLSDIAAGSKAVGTPCRVIGKAE